MMYIINWNEHRYMIVKGMWYYEIINTKTNKLVGSQETFAMAKKVLRKIMKGGK